MTSDRLQKQIDLNNPPSVQDLLEMAAEFDDFKLPSMPLFIDDFLGDTLDLDAKEVGAYMLILMALWRRDCKPIPLNKLGRVARVPRFPAVWGALEHYFKVTDEGVSNRKLESVWRYVCAKSLISRHAGRQGGLRKSLKIIDGGSSGAGSGAKASHSHKELSNDNSLGPIPEKKRRSPRRALPEDFVPDISKAQALMSELDLNRTEMNYCYQRMKDHAQQTDRRLADWNAAFANWVRKAAQDQEIGPGSRGRKAQANGGSSFDVE